MEVKFYDCAKLQSIIGENREKENYNATTLPYDVSDIFVRWL